MRVSDRLESFRHAFRGVGAVFASQPNARIHAAVTAAVCALGALLGVSAADWRWLVAAIAMVWVAELMNTALEWLADATSPERQPLVGKAKDAAAGAVLLAAVAAATIGLLVFVPRLLALG